MLRIIIKNKAPPTAAFKYGNHQYTFAVNSFLVSDRHKGISGYTKLSNPTIPNHLSDITIPLIIDQSIAQRTSELR